MTTRRMRINWKNTLKKTAGVTIFLDQNKRELVYSVEIPLCLVDDYDEGQEISIQVFAADLAVAT